MKKLTSILLAIVLLILSVPIGSYASDEPISLIHTEEIRYADGSTEFKTFDENGNEVDLSGDDSFTLSSATIPSAYDSRDYGRITSVKNQGSIGSCWAFAFCAVAESSLITQGYNTKDNIDLSEAHLVRFRSAYDKNSSNPVQQDDYTDTRDTFAYGGNFYYACAGVARWSGFAKESDFPYYNDASKMQFSINDAFRSDYTLYKMRLLSTADEIKDSVMQNGAVVCSYYNNYDYNKSSRGYTYYQNEKTTTSHAVTLVGWDDNFPASAFKTNPGKNGAWLIKNSWGSSWGDSGYFWLSYCDTSVSSFIEVIAKPKELENNYQYTGVYCLNSIGFSSAVFAANVFTAKGKELVKSCSFYSVGDSVQYTATAYLYTNLTNAKNPSSGTLRASKTVNVNKIGYYQVDFDDEYTVEAGSKFSIVIKFKSSASTTYIPIEKMGASGCSYSVQSGQSFYSTSGTSWKDNTALTIGTSTFGNYPIRAFTVDVPVSMSIIKSPRTEYYVGESFDIDNFSAQMTFTNRTVEVDNSKITFIYDFSSEGNKNVQINYRGLTQLFPVSVIDKKTIITPAIDTVRIDTEKNIIKGIGGASKNLDNVLNVKNGFTYDCASYGTGGTLTVKKNGEVVSEYQLLVYGDVTGDSYYDGQDAVISKCISEGMLTESTISSLNIEAADCNGDGVLNELDIEILEQAGTYNIQNQNILS